MTRVWIWFAIAALLLGGVVGVATVSEDKSRAAAEAKSGVSPPEPGVYHYNGPSQFTVEVKADGSGRGITRQIMTLPSGVGFTLRNHVVWSATSARSTYSEVINEAGGEGGGFSGGERRSGPAPSCQWRPATLEYAFPLEVEKRWTMKSSCTTAVFGRPSTIERSEEAVVGGRGMITIDGERIDVWDIHRTASYSFSTPFGQERFTAVTKSVEEFAPSLGLFVSLEEDQGPASGKFTLQSLTPTRG